MRVTGLITQGAKRIGSPEYVKSYKVAYSDDGKTWRTYKVKGKDEDMVSLVYAYLYQLLWHIDEDTYSYTCSPREQRL